LQVNKGHMAGISTLHINRYYYYYYYYYFEISEFYEYILHNLYVLMGTY
jgi:hypothetical protein